jgi:spermidine/putrescine transport system ATP-binding protein
VTLGEAAVRLAEVTKRFRDIVAVDRMDLSVERGSFFSILGPSGCGKTTTLRMIAGFEIPDEGEILLGDRPVSRIPPYHRNVNTVFQSYALFEHLSVWDNVAFGLRRKRLPDGEITRRVGDMLDLVHLQERSRAKPRQLSGGQQQRVALARALVNFPSVLLLDEPLGALDLQLRKKMQLELKHIQRELGVTFIYVTHDQEEALTMSDAIAVMSSGVVQQVGTPEQVYDHPVNEFVAGFIGISNLVPATVGPAEVRLSGGLALPAAIPTSCRPGDAVAFSVRPEKVELRPAPGMVTVDATVVESVYQGIVTQYVLEIGQEARLIAVEKNGAIGDASARPTQGARITVGWWRAHGMVLPRGRSTTGAVPSREDARLIDAKAGEGEP